MIVKERINERIKILKNGLYHAISGLPLFEQVILTDGAGHNREMVIIKEYSV